MHVRCLRLPACFPDKNPNTPKFFPIVDKTFTLVLVPPLYIAAFAKHLLDVCVSQTSDKRLSK